MHPYTLLITELEATLPHKRAVDEAKRYLLGQRLCHDQSGKPYLEASPGLSVSLSHSEHWLAVLLLPIGVPTGVDIEEKGEQAERILPRISSDSERALLREEGRTALHLWTAKEALYKAYSEQLTKGGITLIEYQGAGWCRLHLDDGRELLQEVAWCTWQEALVAHTCLSEPVKLLIK